MELSLPLHRPLISYNAAVHEPVHRDCFQRRFRCRESISFCFSRLATLNTRINGSAGESVNSTARENYNELQPHGTQQPHCTMSSTHAGHNDPRRIKEKCVHQRTNNLPSRMPTCQDTEKDLYPRLCFKTSTTREQASSNIIQGSVGPCPQRIRVTCLRVLGWSAKYLAATHWSWPVIYAVGGKRGRVRMLLRVPVAFIHLCTTRTWRRQMP